MYTIVTRCPQSHTHRMDANTFHATTEQTRSQYIAAVTVYGAFSSCVYCMRMMLTF